MKKHDGDIRGFHWSSKAWYKKVIDTDKINFGLYSQGSTTGEMSITWESIGNKSAPLLKVFDDAWSALSLFPDLIQKMGEHDDENITPEQFVEILLSCGFKDLTKYKEDENV